jgi:septal ring factor EnvC (AmiA/AmiB activator)
MKFTVPPILIAILFLGGCMPQKEVSVLDGRVADLEKQAATLSQQKARLDAQDKQTQAIRRQVAKTAADLDRLREEIEGTRGNLEVIEHQVAKKLSAADDVDAKRKMELERLEAQLVVASQKIDRILQYPG